ncbi:Neuroendocrine convertase 1 [Armadillidium vulgare]|nr:Neuroendocrine convertase 1 [Armadillidium vulgare]
MRMVVYILLIWWLCSSAQVSSVRNLHQNGVHFQEDREKQDGVLQDEKHEDFEDVLEKLEKILSHEVIQNDNQVVSTSDDSMGKLQEHSVKSYITSKFSRRTLDNDVRQPKLKKDMSGGPTLQKKREEDTPGITLERKYLNEWVVHMSGGEEITKKVVKELGYKFNGPVMWAEQQVARPRFKRSHQVNMTKQNSLKNKIKNLKSQVKMFNDSMWKHQWYLFDSRTRIDLPELDLKVIPLWKSGITGKGVNVVIVDDGLEWKHPDLIRNYVRFCNVNALEINGMLQTCYKQHRTALQNANISYDLNDNDVDPSPRYDQARTNSHGTKCAGEIAMQPNNGICGVGVAYGVSIGGIRMLDGDVYDLIEGTALAMNQNSVDIISCSWGPKDNGTVVEGPGTLAKMALEKGVKEGRDGKGIIYVWASGNGGYVSDNCNCDGYVSSIYTIGVSSASENGVSPWYSEHCASTLTSTYSSGAYSDQQIVTTDIENDCTVSFSGTSASAPLAAGIIALALEVNPSLTWRDIQHIIVRASSWLPLSHDDGWQQNGAGYHFNIKFGFGLLMAEPLVKIAQNWTTVSEKKICEAAFSEKSTTFIQSGGSVEMEAAPLCNLSTQIDVLEHLQVLLTLNHTKRGDLEIRLTSPQGK